MRISRLSVAFGLLLALAVATPSKANSVYNINLSGWGASLTGTIETDGTIGALNSDLNIISYSLTLTQGLNSGVISGLDPFSTSSTFGSTPYFTATSSSLFFDFGAGVQYILLGAISGPPFTWVCLSGSGSGCGHGNVQMRINGSGIFDSGSYYQGLTEIGSLVTPLPAALPLFVTGFGALLGLLGLWGKRKVLPKSNIAA